MKQKTETTKRGARQRITNSIKSIEKQHAQIVLAEMKRYREMLKNSKENN